MHADTDQIPLECQPRLRVHKPWRRYVETLLVISALFLGGVGTGYVAGLRDLDAALNRRNAEHLVEIERLQAIYESRVYVLTGRVGEAAATAEGAAQAAAQAARQAAAASRQERKP